MTERTARRQFRLKDLLVSVSLFSVCFAVVGYAFANTDYPFPFEVDLL